MNTYIIANGGCGERLASVLFMLYQCGYYGTQDPIKGVLIVDNDEANPAHIYLNDMINDINNMNRVIGRTEIPQIAVTSWAPIVNNAQTLGALAKTAPEIAAFSLISTEEELNQIIDGKGYAGHVNIGVTVVNSALETRNNKDIFEGFLNSACALGGRREARFIIIGSTHGGTGAALNTAIGERIRKYYQGQDNRIEIFGLFMLSYYSIPDSDPYERVQSGDQIRINRHQFRPADIEALSGYRGKDLVHGTFNNILFCGYDPRPHTNNKHREGGNNQDNRFSIPEMLMCAGAYFIFDPDNRVPANEYVGINLQSGYNGALFWNNMPNGERLKKCLGRMGLFACSMSETDDSVPGSWGSVLTNNQGSVFSSLYYMQKKNQTEERPMFFSYREQILNFLSKFWNMIYQISTDVNDNWNDSVVLFKRMALEGIPQLVGFQWTRNNTGTDSIIIDVGKFEGRVPTMTALDSEFGEALKNNRQSIRNDSHVKDRATAYFGALFDACDNTYGLGVKNNG